jgi:sigma-E factor negative regulatory protein RseB
VNPSRPGLGRRRCHGRGVAAPSSIVLSAAAAVVILTLLLVPPVRATAAPPEDARDDQVGSDVAALRLIERASGAEATTAYEGTQFVASWGSRSTSHLLHVRHEPGRGTIVQMLGNGAHSGGGLREDGDAVSALANAEALDLLERNYDVLTSGVESVAGREADVIEAWRHDDADRAHPVARFWLDRGSGVLLRRESYDETGRTVRGSAFFDIRVDEPKLAAVAPSSPDASALPDVSDPDHGQLREDLTAMTSAGWICPPRLADGLELRAARRLDNQSGQVLHLAYSDGLATVSVFEQRGRLDDAGLDGFRQVRLGGGTVHVRDGLPQQLIWTSRDTVFTVVTDAPDETVAAAVAALPMAEPADVGLMARLGRGFSRAAAWFAPS